MEHLRNDYRKRFGMLWFVLSLTGIDVFEESDVKRSFNILRMIRKWCFPILLFANFCSLFSQPIITLSSEKFNWVALVDLFLPFLPIFLWILMFRRRVFLKNLITHLNTIVLEDLVLPRCFTWVVNASIIINFVTPFILILMSLFCRSEEHISKEVQFRYLHETLFPSLVTITYCSICYVFIKYLQAFKAKFDSFMLMSDVQSMQMFVKSYVNVVKGIDIFQDIFSALIFFVLCQDFAVITVYVLDILEANKAFLISMMPEMITYSIYTLCSFGILTVIAAEIPLKMHRVKTTILNAMTMQAQNDEEICSGKQLSLLLKRDISVLSVCDTFALTRAFILKAIIALFVVVVILYQVGGEMQPE